VVQFADRALYLRDRALYLPTFSHLMIVNKLYERGRERERERERELIRNRSDTA
jgi:hypothetical protein